MPRLKTLKPRVQTISTNRVKEVAPADSWRADKTSTQRGYGYKWQKARERFLRANPLCVYCQREGRLTAATVVDHVKPHKGDRVLFWDESNWQPLCKPCHDSVKAREEGGRGM